MNDCMTRHDMRTRRKHEHEHEHEYNKSTHLRGHFTPAVIMHRRPLRLLGRGENVRFGFLNSGFGFRVWDLVAMIIDRYWSW